MVDTTVQPKAIMFPTDAKVLHAASLGEKGNNLHHPPSNRRGYRGLPPDPILLLGREFINAQPMVAFGAKRTLVGKGAELHW